MNRSALLAAILLPAFLMANTASAKTLVYCSEGSPENFSPSTNTTGTSSDVLLHLYSGLTDFERGGTRITNDGVAESWDISDDGLTYTFHLRKGVKWHSSKNFKPSRDLTADDVIFSFERQWKEDHPYFRVTSSNHTYFDNLGIGKILKSIEKIDDYTVRFVLNQPDAPLLANFAVPFAGIQSKEYADMLLKAGTPEKIDQEPIGTGPFYLVQYQKDALVRFKAFSAYYRGKAQIDDLVFAITPDASVRWAKLQKGECHVMAYPSPADIEAMQKNPGISILKQLGLNIGYLAYNVTKKPLDDVRVRRALNMAINKKAIIDTVYMNTGAAAINPIPPTMWSYNDTIKDDPYDPEASKKFLTDAGVKDLTIDLWALPVQRPYNPNGRRVAELMQADLAKIGVKAEIKSFEWGEYRKRLQAGEHMTGQLGWTSSNADPDDFLTNLLSCDAAKIGGGNIAKWCNEEFQKLISEARIITDQAKRADIYGKAQEIFKREAPWFTIAHAVQIAPIRNEVIGYKLNPFSYHNFYGVDIKAK